MAPIHPLGRLAPENSAPAAGAIITSPSDVSATYVFATQFAPFPSQAISGVPAEKSSVDVSCSVGPGTVKLGASETAALAA